ncbi:hypothetical protein [Enterococcus italicus]|uniref:hypothetical protein n=1 Tax=Enterococcus italicus TaxID=246144 RepID=UPI002073C8F5|nr:hypothetical protein [Enterococcus italicus]
MYKPNEIVPIQIQNQVRTDTERKKSNPAKLAMRLKKADGSEVLIYNGINSYILTAVLKELN